MSYGISRGRVAVVATSIGLLLGTVAPVHAGNTDVTFSLSGGPLSVAVPPTANLGAKGSAGTTTVSGTLGNTVVTDNRGGTVGWIAKASTTAFANGKTTATAVSYNAGTPTFTGTVTPVSSGETPLTAEPAKVVEATLVVGNNTVTWNPTLTITLPPTSTAGTYSGTITTSVS